MKKIKILLVIRSLFIGGAERQWVLLAKGLAQIQEVELLLCTFYQGGQLENEIAGIPHICLNKKGKGDFHSLYKYPGLCRWPCAAGGWGRCPPGRFQTVPDGRPGPG